MKGKAEVHDPLLKATDTNPKHKPLKLKALRLRSSLNSPKTADPICLQYNIPKHLSLLGRYTATNSHQNSIHEKKLNPEIIAVNHKPRIAPNPACINCSSSGPQKLGQEVEGCLGVYGHLLGVKDHGVAFRFSFLVLVLFVTV